MAAKEIVFSSSARSSIAQGLNILGMQFHQRQAVLRPQQMPGNPGRTGITPQDRPIRVLGPDRIQIVGQQWRGGSGLQQAADAVLIFQGLAGFDAIQVIAANARMGIDHRKGGVLLFQMGQNQGQQGMLDHIGEVSGMIGVAVVHGGGQYPTAPPCRKIDAIVKSA